MEAVRLATAGAKPAKRGSQVGWRNTESGGAPSGACTVRGARVRPWPSRSEHRSLPIDAYRSCCAPHFHYPARTPRRAWGCTDTDTDGDTYGGHVRTRTCQWASVSRTLSRPRSSWASEQRKCKKLIRRARDHVPSPRRVGDATEDASETPLCMQSGRGGLRAGELRSSTLLCRP